MPQGDGDHDRTWTNHADGDGDQELPSIEPPHLPHQPVFEKRHDDETAAECEASALRKKPSSLPRISLYYGSLLRSRKAPTEALMALARLSIGTKAASFVQGFVKGAYAAIGTILGACVLLGKIAIGDWLTASLGLGALPSCFGFKVSNPLLITATAVIGLIAFPLVQRSWVFVK
jgi:hypothetical protein